MAGILLPACSIFFSTLLCIVYFSKKRINIPENKVYNVMLIASLIDSIIVTILQTLVVINKVNDYLFLIVLLNKIDFISLITISACLLIYSLLITVKLNENTMKKLTSLIYVIDIISFILILPLSLDVIKANDVTTITGLSATVTNIICAILIIISICIPLFNIKRIDKRHIPIFSILLIVIVLLCLYQINPYIIVISISITFINYLMYFTMQNPDVRMLEQISLAKDQAEKANAAKTDFLSSMSHEIRTPLNAIVGFSEAIKEEETLEAAKQDAKDIILASQNLLDIVNGILDISKIEANKMEIVNTEYDLTEECQLLAKLVKPRIGEKPIDLITNIAPDIPKTLYGDKSKVREIISNLLTNAIKYTESGTIEFNVSCINKNDECSLVLSVEDTGRGIKPEKIDKLFTKFERLDEDRNTTIEGAGLGLAITKSLVEMLGGKIIVQSVFGSGSKFTVYLKQRIVSEKKYHLNNNFTKEALDLSGKRVLIVDDNTLNIKVAERLLKKYNLIIDSCESGRACLEKIQNGEIYDLILMDDMMPKMSGTETFHLLKEIPSFKTRVVVLTANAIEGMKDKYLSIGFDDYLSKPMDASELERVLRKFLNKEYTNNFAPLPDDFYEISETAILNINELNDEAKK